MSYAKHFKQSQIFVKIRSAFSAYVKDIYPLLKQCYHFREQQAFPKML